MTLQSIDESRVPGARGLQEEITQVGELLRASFVELQPPFRQLVQAQFEGLQPLARAAVVLTAAVGAPDTPALRTQRIDLAAALEMLSLATKIHTHLMAIATADSHLDRTLLGSTILAGDFCFSRAAGFAVKTGSAAVVEIFAQTLKQLSEAHLRTQFSATALASDNRDLFVAGLLAAGNLVGWEAALLNSGPTIGSELALLFDNGTMAAFAAPESFSSSWTPAQAERWHYLPIWLATESRERTDAAL